MSHSPPSLDQEVPKKRKDKFLLLTTLEEAKEELEKILKTKLFNITKYEQKNSVATHEIEYPYENMYNLRGVLFQAVEFTFEDYDYYSLFSKSDYWSTTINAETILKDERVAKMIDYDSHSRIILFKTSKDRTLFCFDMMKLFIRYNSKYDIFQFPIS